MVVFSFALVSLKAELHDGRDVSSRPCDIGLTSFKLAKGKVPCIGQALWALASITSRQVPIFTLARVAPSERQGRMGGPLADGTASSSRPKNGRGYLEADAGGAGWGGDSDDGSLEHLIKRLWADEPDGASGKKGTGATRGSLAAAAAADAEAAHRGRDDEWYLERRAHCCTCGRCMAASGVKAGRQCCGCRRWFHDGCVPVRSGTGSGSGSDSSAAGISGDARGRPWFHCDSCADLRWKLQEAALVSARARRDRPAAAAVAAPAGGRRAGGAGSSWARQGGGSNVVFLDLVEMRRELERGEDGGQRPLPVPGGGAGGAGVTRTGGAEFKPEAGMRHQRLANTVGTRVSSADHGDDDVTAAGDSSRELLCGPAARRDLAAVSRIFSSVGPGAQATGLFGMNRISAQLAEEQREELLEADYALLVRDMSSGQPVAAASLLVFGSDPSAGGHARIHSIATLPEARRRGHCRSLLAEAQRLLACSGIPRLVVMYPPTASIADDAYRRGVTDAARLVEGADGGVRQDLARGFARGLGFSELSIPLLSDFKASFSEYHRDLTRGMAYLTMSLSASGRQQGHGGWGR